MIFFLTHRHIGHIVLKKKEEEKRRKKNYVSYVPMC
jgi:ABC-type Mn2+/Zn2+ transport system ATPase subunit